LNKSELLSLFSSDYKKYYNVSLFDNLGFTRQGCTVCGRFFWSITQKAICPDHENYSFIGNPPTEKRFGYTQAWNEIKKYFESNNHEIVNRYPVVCRWREDLYYTIASIVDFQRIAENRVIFELPKNPLIVPQMCLRFNDIENVGITGRHYTSFCMIGQTCDADSPGGYWKDHCIDLDFNLLVDVFGISPTEITFVEDVWIGAGAFGSSLEYFVRGLELGNAVFTEFEGTENNYKVMKNKIIDMGAGLERLAWITNGTPTSYDCTFDHVLTKILGQEQIYSSSSLGDSSEIKNLLSDYFKRVSTRVEFNNDLSLTRRQIANEMGIDVDKLQKIVVPFESLYTIIDHVRTLVFAISDGSLPSNVGGGYNLRVLLRRTLSLLKQLKLDLRISDVVDLHIEQLSSMYPELEEYREDIHTILKIESERFSETQNRITTIASKIKKQKNKLGIDDLLRLYESDGVTPDYLVEVGLLDSIPTNFYTRLAEIHSINKPQKVEKNDFAFKDNFDFSTLERTKLLYYENPLELVFSARVVKVFEGNFVVLDRTGFYPRGGGQEPDHGYIGPSKVNNVVKIGDIVIHHVEGSFESKEGEILSCVVEKERRDAITRNHTSTHIINYSSKNILGSWVWQNSAFKEEQYARLDITHHSSLSRSQMQQIEKRANEIVRQNLPVSINFYDRGIAEQDYGFSIYQGGVVPSNNVRIVKVGGLDIEACGGTHVFNTGEIGLIKILKTERIQDGVVRIEFVSGENALNRVQIQDDQIYSLATKLGTSREKLLETLSKTIEDFDKSKKKLRNILRNTSPLFIEKILKDAKNLELIPETTNAKINYYLNRDENHDEEFHLAAGKLSTEKDHNLVYIGLIMQESESIKIVVFCGKIIAEKINANIIASNIARNFGGSGGGTKYFGQGGGNQFEKFKTIEDSIEYILKNLYSEKK
jgi:alanyl-tRNA synthetase